jgi:serine protease AprX
MKRRFFGPVVVAIAAAALMMSRSTNPSSKLDRALQEWLKHPKSSTRVMVRAREGATATVANRFPGLRPLSGGNFFVADVTAAMLRSLAADRDIMRASSDALVHTLGTSYLSQDVLLNTEGLLPRIGSGAGITVAVVDSGILPNANEKVFVTYDFTKSDNGSKVGALDPFGHGTHVAGMVASAGATSSDLYEGMAPGVRLIALRALDAQGVGYTSTVINAINFAIANKAALKIDVLNLSLGHPIN